MDIFRVKAGREVACKLAWFSQRSLIDQVADDSPRRSRAWLASQRRILSVDPPRCNHEACPSRLWRDEFQCVPLFQELALSRAARHNPQIETADGISTQNYKAKRLVRHNRLRAHNTNDSRHLHTSVLRWAARNAAGKQSAPWTTFIYTNKYLT
jgi:hypothetical protein